MSTSANHEAYVPTFRCNIVGDEEDVPLLVMADGVVRAGHRAAGTWGFVLNFVTKVCVAVWVPDNSTTLMWRGQGPSGLAPHLPQRAVDRSEAVAALREARQGAGTGGEGATRGVWTGRLHFCGQSGTPMLALTRRIASYGKLAIASSSEGWGWKFFQDAKWFAQPKTLGETAKPETSFAAVLQEAHQAAMGSVREACGYRDTTRRAAVDREYAAAHPRKPRRASVPRESKVEKHAERTAAKEKRRHSKKAERDQKKRAAAEAKKRAKETREREHAAKKAAARAAKQAERDAKKAARKQEAERARAQRKTQSKRTPKPKGTPHHKPAAGGKAKHANGGKDAAKARKLALLRQALTAPRAAA